MECNEKLRTCMDQMEQHRTQLRNVQLEQYQCTTKYDVCLSIYISVYIIFTLSPNSRVVVTNNNRGVMLALGVF